MEQSIQRSKLRRTHCIKCGAELTEETGYAKSGRMRGWHSRCKRCQKVSRRKKHDDTESTARLFVTREVCDICKQPERSTRGGVVRELNKDHDHTTGEWRGLLCSRCNMAIGLLSDNTELLKRAIEYLEDPPGLVLLDDPGPESRQQWRQSPK